MTIGLMNMIMLTIINDSVEEYIVDDSVDEYGIVDGSVEDYGNLQ